MKKRTLHIVLILTIVLAVAACQRGQERKSGEVVTETIDPAAAKPSETTTSEMTQTVELQDGRSEADGGVITSPNPPIRTRGSRPPAPDTAATATETATAPKRKP